MSDLADLPPNDQSDYAVKTLDSQTLEPPSSRLGKSWAIRQRIVDLRNNDRERGPNRAKIQRWIDGQQPYDATKLTNAGQRDRTNFNPQEAQGMVDQSVAPYYSVVFRNPKFATMSNTYGESPFLQRLWSDNMAANFHTLLEEWSGFSYQMRLMFKQMVTFGIGLPMFPDSDTWQMESRKNGEVLVPDEIPADIGALPELAYFTKMSAVDLFRMVDKPKAKEMGWFPETAKRFIAQNAPDQITGMPEFGQSFNEQWAESLRRGDVMWNGEKARIPIAGYLVKEFDGKISRVLLLDSKEAVVADNGGTAGDEYLIFKKEREFECYQDFLIPFFQNIGNGDWHSVKGLGRKIRDLTISGAKILCRHIDKAIKSGGFIFQALDDGGEQISQLIEISGGTVIPSSLHLEENRFDQSVQGGLLVRREVQDVLQTSSASYLPRVSGENSEPTLGQAQLNYQNQSKLSESDMDSFFKSMDPLLREILKRALKQGLRLYRNRHQDGLPPDAYDAPDNFDNDAERGAYWMVRRNVQDGVPLEAQEFKWLCSIRATRGVGSGSPAGTDIATKELISMAPAMDARGRQNAFRARAAFLMGYSNVDEYFPPFDDVGMPDDQAAMATLENNALRTEGGELLVTPKQDPVVHSRIHISDAFDHLKKVQGGQGNPMELLVHLHQAGPHIKTHLMAFEGDKTREREYKQLDAAWLQLSKATDQLQQQVIEHLQSQQAQGPPQPQMDPAMTAAIIKAHGEVAIKAQKTQAGIKLAAIKQQAAQSLKDLQAAHDMKLKQAIAAHDVSVKTNQFRVDSAIQAAQAVQDAQTQSTEQLAA